MTKITIFRGLLKGFSVNSAFSGRVLKNPPSVTVVKYIDFEHHEYRRYQRNTANVDNVQSSRF